jgi:hypothetical protein
MPDIFALSLLIRNEVRILYTYISSYYYFDVSLEHIPHVITGSRESHDWFF